MTEVIGAAVDPLLAVKVYLDAEFAARSLLQHIGVSVPEGNPSSYVTISCGDGWGRGAPGRFTAEHLIDVVVYDKDAVQAGKTTRLIHALLLSVCNTPVETVQGRTHLIAGRPDFGPVDYPDPDVPLFGRRMGVRVLMSNSVL